MGRRLLRIEDARLVTGRGQFADDIDLPGALHLEFLRSSRSTGRIVRIDGAAARAASGVIALYTAGDLTLNGEPTVNPMIPGLVAPTFHALAGEHINAVGQPIAAVIASTRAAALDATELIDIQIADTVEPPAQRVAFTQSIKTAGCDALFAAAAHIVTVDLDYARLAPMALEPRAAAAHYNTSTGQLTLWLSTQTPHRAQENLARLLNTAPDKIRVVAADVGGAFGGKGSIYPEEVVVAWAAMTLRRPVRWCATRSDEMLAATQGRGQRIRGEMAADATGRCVAVRARVTATLGHWMPFSGAIPARNAVRCVPGPYDIAAVDLVCEGQTDNTASVGIYRGAGRPEATMLMERLMDAMSRKLGRDPAAFRADHLLAPQQLPHKMPTGETLDSGDYPALLARAKQLTDYAQLCEAIRARRAGGAVCGLGIACYVEPCGQGWESATLTVEPGGRIRAAVGSTAQGQGRSTSVRQIVADALGVMPEQVDVDIGDTAATPNGVGALASRSTAIGGSALLKAAADLRALAQPLAAVLLQAREASWNGRVFAAATQAQVDWSQLADAHPGQLSAAVQYTAAGEAWSSGCCIATVSIETDTGVPTIETIVWVDDAGTIVNPMLVEGQLLGGLAQGVGEALMEQLVYSADKQLLTGSLMDYAVPRAADIPPVTIDKLSTPSPANLLGAKGVGEAGCIGVPAAIVNAVMDALQPYAIDHLDMPLTSAKIWHAMQPK